MKRSFLLLVFCSIFTVSSADNKTALKLATTTSTENSGLLSVLLPKFTEQYGAKIHVIAVGSGKAMMHGKNGDVDVLLVHSPKAEKQFVDEGFGVHRQQVMYNDFVLVGPENDPASVNNSETVVDCFTKIAKTNAVFISRGDESGTHAKERTIWKMVGSIPEGKWYIQAGQGMGAVLMMANEKQGYTLSDRGTFIAFEKKVQSKILFEGDKALYNQYSVIAVNPEKHPQVNTALARTFIKWLTGEKCQKDIGAFRKNGKQLFFPNASESTGK